ncbi:hypothetical protein GKZ89_09380 [Bacillus mangrovi]|uniref:YqcI/YcgG family protein n=1 Tax=Metabacillus mangrovi TaxID=1491830 RepID=A0A7X2S4Q4_9BACI|nr:YqcI/YcgG family protein [Metabacillus mangrovi]MTH53614.1 hypothetical protein [Metabacillus mangrovi]
MLYNREEIESETPGLEDWQRDAFVRFSGKLSSGTDLFPCIPATIGHKLHHFRYAFFNDPKQEGTLIKTAAALKQYGRLSRDFGPYTSLICFFNTDYPHYETEDYRTLFWDALQQLNRLDGAEWPEHIPKDPEHHLWEYCFEGEQYFMYCGTPAHQRRQTRHSPYFIWAITPRWVLDRFNEAEERARKMKESIRERIQKYDSISIHPDLNSYGSDENFEWKQYFLSDDQQPAGKCPFAHLHPAKKE